MLIIKTKIFETKNSIGDLTIPPPKAEEKNDGSANEPWIIFEGNPTKNRIARNKEK